MSFFLLFCRKVNSFIFRLSRFFSGLIGLIKLIISPNINIGTSNFIDSSAKIRAIGNGTINIGNNVCISNDAYIIVETGVITISDDVFIGPFVHIVCQESIVIGQGSQIAEFVVIRDQDHVIGCGPLAKSGFKTGSVFIGSNVWIGTKSTLLRGIKIGDNAVIGAHSLVRTNVPENHLAAGIPAKIIKKL